MVLGLGFKGFGGLRWFGFQIDFMWFVYIRSFFYAASTVRKNQAANSVEVRAFRVKSVGFGI